MAKAKQTDGKLDIATVGGLLLAAFGIVGGLLLEGGRVQDISQITAAFIVLGGTIGAVMVNTPMKTLRGGVKRLKDVFFEKRTTLEHTLEDILLYAAKARKNGIVALEDEAESIADPFLKKALNLAIDGTDLQDIRAMMELEMEIEEYRAESEARVFESAGGYAPTVGIIGAVMGLIQVMKHLENIEEVGHGIAVAFVATVYGVALANLFFLPAANKIKARAHEETLLRELILEGVVGIVEGMNPKLIRSKLLPYIHGDRMPEEVARRVAGARANA
jgi:chemotaxis protein MotA